MGGEPILIIVKSNHLPMRKTLMLWAVLIGGFPILIQGQATFASLKNDTPPVPFSLVNEPDAESEAMVPIWALETQPAFEGGQQALSNYFDAHLDYTDLAREYAVEGLMILRLVLTAEGSPEQVEVLRSLGHGLDEIATKAISAMPNWIPGSYAGHPVKTSYILPLRFRLAP